MSVSGEPIREEQILVRYLLGSLPEEETERVDELSVTNDDFVWRLRAAENELVDAYLRNELTGDTLKQFRAHYLQSPRRREKLKLAETLMALVAREPAPVRRWLAIPLMLPRWGLAAAVVVALLTTTYLVYDNVRLRERVLQAERPRTPQLPIRAKPAPSSATTAAIVLLPPRRGAAPIPELALNRGVDRATFELKLEAEDFPTYRVALKREAGGQRLWNSGELKASEGKVPVTLPASLLEAGTYILELSSSGAGSEVIADYTFRVTPR
jgi:hypothetical protein